MSNLNNLSLNHHYAISVHGSLSLLKNKEQVFCDLPAYAVNANALSDIGRHTDKIHIATDDAEVAKQRVDKFISKESAVHYKSNSKNHTQTHTPSTEPQTPVIKYNDNQEMGL